MFDFKCGNCNHNFKDENDLTYCPMCCEICERKKEEKPKALPKPVSAPAQSGSPPPYSAVQRTQKPAVTSPQPAASSADDFFAPEEAEYEPAMITPAATASPTPGSATTTTTLPLPQQRCGEIRNPRRPPHAVLLPKAVHAVSISPKLQTVLDDTFPGRKRPASSLDSHVAAKRPRIEAMTSVWSTIKAHHNVLLIGEGNFSFAFALCARIGTGRGVVATDVEMHHELQDPSGCDEAVAKLLMLGATLHCGTDVTKLSTDSPWMDRIGKFDYMSWAFPHTRTPNRDKSSVPEHRWLLRSFIDQAAILLKPGGKALITVKEGYPYNSWDVAGLKTDAVEYETMEPFLPKDFPQYRHVTTVGAPIMQITPATTHIFTKPSGDGEVKKDLCL